MTRSDLTGLRVLVVEDELAIATMLEIVLDEQHCTVVGPYGSLDEALAERGVPFLLLSGYGDSRLPPDKQDWPIRAKPFNLDELISHLARLVRVN